MEIFFNSLLFLSGLAVLIFTSHWLLQASVKLSFIYRLAPLFIGVGIIGFGTSLPELGVGITAAIVGAKDIALGNIIGSYIANIGLILGLCALIVPAKVDKGLFKRELPIMVSAGILLYLVSLDKVISRLDGVGFLVCFVIFLTVTYRAGKKSFDSKEIKNFPLNRLFRKLESRFMLIGLVVFFLSALVAAAFLMVKGGSKMAELFGISPWIVGITVFAIGTSLPELAASLTASFKKMPSISLGNVVGSNIFNIFFALGVIALIKPIQIEPSLLRFELPVMLIFSFFLFTVMKTGYLITRKEGLCMFIGYIIFITILILK